MGQEQGAERASTSSVTSRKKRQQTGSRERL